MNSIQQLQTFQRNWMNQLPTCQSTTSMAINYLDDSKLLTEKEFNITNSSIQSLLIKINKGQLTSFEVLISFIKKSLLCQSINKTTGNDFDYRTIGDAILRAQYLDFYYQNYGKTLSKFHGLPIGTNQLLKYKSILGLNENNNEGIDAGIIEIDGLDIQLNLRQNQLPTGYNSINSNTCYSRSFQARAPSQVKI
ncbi:hypothetical protein DFJ63DRAFT_312686 [Scheffersomyces coipomensis]|uniref:uncharacterized protein n=1 Tax=Scheffersomyces coipomensis TaxID=1788519 RepID=UPI00315CA48D